MDTAIRDRILKALDEERWFLMQQLRDMYADDNDVAALGLDWLIENKKWPTARFHSDTNTSGLIIKRDRYVWEFGETDITCTLPVCLIGGWLPRLDWAVRDRMREQGDKRRRPGRAFMKQRRYERIADAIMDAAKAIGEWLFLQPDLRRDSPPRAT